jgi:hypothetical protein
MAEADLTTISILGSVGVGSAADAFWLFGGFFSLRNLLGI